MRILALGVQTIGLAGGVVWHWLMLGRPSPRHRRGGHRRRLGAEPGVARLGAWRAEIPTAPVAAGTLIVGYAVASASGSRPLGGLVLLAGGMWCARAWMDRNGPRTAISMVSIGLIAFILSHVLALAIGAWPSVLLVSAVAAAVVWTQADSRRARAAHELAFRPPSR